MYDLSGCFKFGGSQGFQGHTKVQTFLYVIIGTHFRYDVVKLDSTEPRQPIMIVLFITDLFIA